MANVTLATSQPATAIFAAFTLVFLRFLEGQASNIRPHETLGKMILALFAASV